MESGSIVEYIDQQRIMCAVVLEVKKLRLRLLTENNREIKLSANRLSHRGGVPLDPAMGRDRLVEALKEIAGRRRALIDAIDIQELWELFNGEQEWIDLATMTGLCFPENPSPDHEAAVVRAFFGNRLYFKFDFTRFFPHSAERVEQIQAQQREEERRNRLIEAGGRWLRAALNSDRPVLEKAPQDIVPMLADCYLFGKESEHFAMCQDLLKRAELKDPEKIFELLVRLGVWHRNENIDILRCDVATEFSEAAVARASALCAVGPDAFATNGRRDLTALPTLTIDGQSTLDFDDALSIEDHGAYCRLGIHITDVGHCVPKGDVLDAAARERGSSIYMADRKVPMLPPELAEDVCSLKAGQLRPAISTLVSLSPTGQILNYEIVPSIIRVQRQLSYYDVNQMANGDDEEILLLKEIGIQFRRKRLEQGAIQITLPEINIWLNPDGDPVVSRINRESPGRLLVSEIMIMANWLTARFLADNQAPAIFRSQAGPKERLYKHDEGSLFQNWMQRKLLSRFVLTPVAEPHSGLGLEAYVTATSPIRKYFDLVTQRQVRGLFGMEPLYTREEIERIIQWLELPMGNIGRLQSARQRYWLLKYLENNIGQKAEAIVLAKRRNDYAILMKDYMIECSLPVSAGVTLKPEDLVQVTIQHVNARKDVLSVYLG